jgi:hypothetical protein
MAAEVLRGRSIHGDAANHRTRHAGDSCEHAQRRYNSLVRGSRRYYNSSILRSLSDGLHGTSGRGRGYDRYTPAQSAGSGPARPTSRPISPRHIPSRPLPWREKSWIRGDYL